MGNHLSIRSRRNNMYYHLIIQLRGSGNKLKTIYLLDQDKIESVRDYGYKFNQGIPFYVDGYRITADLVVRFKVVETDAKLSAVASRKIEAYRRIGVGLLSPKEAILEDSDYSKDITSSILEETNQYVTNETLHLDKLVKDEVEKKISSKQQINVYGNFISGNVTNSQVVSNNEMLLFDRIKDLLNEVKKTMKAESLTKEQVAEASEIVSDIEQSVQHQKKPSVIRNALKGLKDLLMEFGASVSAKLIEDKCNGMW